MNQSVLYEQNNGVALITLNRPQTRNAINDELVAGLVAAFEQARDDDAVRAIVLAGAGKGFCAGADLSAFGAELTPDMLYNYLVQKYQPLMALICSLPKPVIGAINGVSAGAGASLALACDLRVMADDASLLQAFSNIGLVPDAGSTWFMVRMVGYSRAFELAAEAERLPANRCLELGLANQLVPADALLDTALSRAAKLAQRPTLALGLTKLALYRAMETNLADAIEYEARLQKQTIVSQDHHEGVAAFLAKRQPQFTGK